jgi:hypothetical protein
MEFSQHDGYGVLSVTSEDAVDPAGQGHSQIT